MHPEACYVDVTCLAGITFGVVMCVCEQCVCGCELMCVCVCV